MSVQKLGKKFALGASINNNKAVYNKVNELIDVTNDLSSGTILAGEDYGIIADGTTDDTAAFNTFMAACKAGSLKGELPKGVILLSSKPNEIDFAWDLGGKGIVSTTLLRGYTEAGTYTGFIALGSGSSGTRIHDVSIQSKSGTTGGCIIAAVSTAAYTIEKIIFENLWVTTQGTDTHNATIVFDGSARVTGSIGIRDISLKDVHCFGANGHSVRFTSVVGLSWMGGAMYSAGGSHADSGGLFISGTATERTQYITVSVDSCSGFKMTQCTEMQLAASAIGTITGGVSVDPTATCTFTGIYGRPAGTVLNNWGTSGIRRPNTGWAAS